MEVMKVIVAIKGILLNVCVICSMVCIALKVLDWYNPYMDFAGHAVFLYALLEAFSAGNGGRQQGTQL